MIVEREREIEAFIPEEYWEVDVAISADEKVSKHTSSAKLPQLFVEGKVIEVLPDGIIIARVTAVDGKKYLPTSEKDVTDVVATLDASTTTYQVTDIEQKERTRASLPPFTTSTLQQQAATRLGFTSKQTMRLAQQLYEEGLITYHRTDSVTLSQTALDMAREYIIREFGQNYVPATPRVFANSSKNAQEAHEAIRVTDVSKKGEAILRESSQFTERHVKLYDLIWRRYLASQMLAAIYLQTAVTVTAQAGKASQGFKTAELKATGSVMKFAGWTTLFPNRDDSILPAVEVNQPLGYVATNPAQKFTQPPPRYNDASLVKELEKRGIGRPSTYASIISVIEDRGYVERDQKRFVATSVGMTVCDFLVAHFPTIMDYDFTAAMENDLDSIAEGGKEWQKVVDAFFKPLAKIIDTVLETAERAQVPVEKTGEKCPDCTEGEIVIRTGRFGKFKSCSRFPDCKYTQNIVETLENQVCPLCQTGQVVVKKSRWGKGFFGCSRYPECGWASWKKPEPGETITAAEWAELQAAREAKKAAREEKFGKSAAASKTSKTAKTAPKKAASKKSTKKTTATKATKKVSSKKTVAKKATTSVK
jgi:DNA topoisomerase-1